ncbi:Aldo/keto reductase [Rickenella mellea]|uniref:Aldo/keto reductase n=1 Tax=Rickenella mellea TaxID=50990 RepID=A0A4Y7PKU4_9AGAM|nr:Aldo/keto reductase [Rickenella mellea]
MTTATVKKFPTRQIGRNGPTVSCLGLGTMGIGAYYGKTNIEEAFKTLTYAADRGVTFWDCADMYGDCEATLGKWFKETGRRSEIFLTSKWGLRDPTRDPYDPKNIEDSTPSYIRRALKRSLSQLGVEYIDLYYQHRVDPRVPIEVVMETLQEYVDNGTIRWIGLSEASPDTLRRAKAVPGVGEKVIATQMEFSPFSLDIEKNGFMDLVHELGMGVVGYAPLGRGLVTGRYRSRADFDSDDFRLHLPRFTEENFPKNLELVDKIKAIADKYNSTPSRVSLAWILAEHPDIVPIPGSRSVARLEDNAGAAELELSPEDVKEIRRLSEQADVLGGRYPDWLLSDGVCIPLTEWKGEEAL